MRKLTVFMIPFLIGIMMNHFAYSQCNGVFSYDNMVSSFHASIALDVDGNYRIWGENSKPSGNKYFLEPTIINKTNFTALTGTPLKTTSGSNTNTNSQHFVLTSDNKLWVWGKEGVVVDASLTSSTAFQTIALPSGVTATDVEMLFATEKTLVILTKTAGNVWVLSQNQKMRGSSTATSTTTWYKVKLQTNNNTDLSGITAVRGSVNTLFALDNSGNLYTWGNFTYLGTSSGFGSSNRDYATLMTNPSNSGGTIKLIGTTSKNSGANNTTYYVLYTDGKLFALGTNGAKQLGNWGVNESTAWVQPRYGSSSGAVMDNIKWISPQEHDGKYAFINVLTNDGVLYNWGEESGSCLGRGANSDDQSSTAVDPGAPSGFTGTSSNTDILAVESGGHTTMILRKCETNFGYVGHKISGSMGDGFDNTATPSTFSFNTKPMQVCGALTAPSIRNDINQNYCVGSTINLIGKNAGGTFEIVSAGTTGSATIIGTQITFNGAGAVKVKYHNVPNMCGEDIVTFNVTVCKSVSGTIWNDLDGDAVQNNGEAGTNNGGMVWVNLVDPNGNVVQSVEADANGNYLLTATSTISGDYKIILTESKQTVGAALSAADPLSNNQKFSGTNIDGTANNGAAAKTGVVILHDFSTSSTNSVNLGIRDVALSANFGSITAQFINGQLVIDFSTLNESNNSLFEIEASTDGVNFTKIGEVISQAKDGNSTETIQYQFSKNASAATTILGFGLLAIGGLGLGFKRNRKLIFGLLMLVGIATAYTGCTKNDTTATKEGNLFIRIAQVDKNGTRTVSKIIKVQK